MSVRSIKEKRDWHGERVLVRVDFNIPSPADIAPEEVLKLTRSLETITWLQKRGAVVMLVSHFGRPEGWDVSYSLRPISDFLQKSMHLGHDFLDGSLENKREFSHIEECVQSAAPGSVILLENLRFYKGEEKNLVSFSKKLASLATCYVNDAFSASHRAHASIVGVPALLPSYAGLSFEREWAELSRVLQNKKKPFIAFFGGKKLSTKLPAIQAMRTRADQLFLGGAMATCVFAARGMSVGKSYLEKECVKQAKELIKAKNVHLPEDVVVSASPEKKVRTRYATPDDIKEHEYIVDIGPRTLKVWAKALQGAKVALWNGPFGVVENDLFAEGTDHFAAIYARYSARSLYGVIGGGDTIPRVVSQGLEKRVDYLAASGGAMLDFFANNGKLPGIQALRRRFALRKKQH